MKSERNCSVCNRPVLGKKYHARKGVITCHECFKRQRKQQRISEEEFMKKYGLEKRTGKDGHVSFYPSPIPKKESEVI